MQYIAAYIFIISMISFFIMGADKMRSRKHGARRVPEAALFTLAVFGGSPGILLGMYVFRHKTRHAQFVICVPMIILAQAYLLWKFL